MSGRTAPTDDSILKRFQQLPFNEHGCQIWGGAILASGYGQIKRRQKAWLAHRLSWALATGSDIPDGLCVMHSCDVRACVNPAHLSVGTHADNTRDMMNKGRGILGRKREPHTRTHCSRGHEYSAANTYINPRGVRVCRACATESAARYYLKNPPGRTWQQIDTHCVHGHARTPENTYVRPAGTGRACKICKRDAVNRCALKQRLRLKATP